MAKQNNTALLVIGAVVAYFLLRKRKTATTSPKQTTTALPMQRTATVANRGEIVAAKQMANQMANDLINQTTFVPDGTTFADLYAKEKSNCR